MIKYRLRSSVCRRCSVSLRLLLAVSLRLLLSKRHETAAVCAPSSWLHIAASLSWQHSSARRGVKQP
eukprot:5811565-Pleurochrysis_carterae.AAC.1